MGVEPTQDESIAPQTVLKTAPVTGPEAAPLSPSSHGRGAGSRRTRRPGLTDWAFVLWGVARGLPMHVAGPGGHGGRDSI